MTATVPFPIAGEDLLDRLIELRALGVTNVAAAADRIGIHKSTLEKAIARARKAGDPRVADVPRQDIAFDDLNTSTMTTANVRIDPEQKLDAAIFVGRQTLDVDVYAELLDELGLIPRPATSRDDLADMLSDLLDEVENQ
jgi:hypothetical protein